MEIEKTVYGLKQASTCFWTAVNAHLLDLGYHSLTGDPCLFSEICQMGRKF